MKIQKLVMGHCLDSNVREDIGIAYKFRGVTTERLLLLWIAVVMTYGGVHSENTEVDDDEPRSRKAILWWFNL